MNTVGHMPDRNFDLGPARKQDWKISPAHLSMQPADAVDAPLPRIARYAILKRLRRVVGIPAAQRQQIRERNSSFCSAYRSRYCSISPAKTGRNPAATAVCVVKRLPARVTASATSNGCPVSSMKSCARSSTANAAWPSFRWHTSGLRPSARSSRQPPMPRSISCLAEVPLRRRKARW